MLIIQNSNNMIIYNVTTNIHESVHDTWIKWMQETHIPEVLATGKFQSAKFVRVLVDEEMGGKTYAVQFAANSWEILQQYYSEDAPRLREESKKLFGDMALSFRTELELISEH